MSKKLLAFLGALAALTMALIFVGIFFAFQFLNSGASEDRTEVIFEVEPNQSMMTVSDNLKTARLIKSKWLFYQYARYMGASARLKRGEYALNQGMTPNEIILSITSGKSIARNLTVVEGASIFEIADAIEKTGLATKPEFFSLVKDKEFIKQVLGEPLESLEGYLFPETYKYTKFDSLKETLGQMVRRFQIVWAEFEPQAKAMGWSRNQVITLASVVEKETGHEADRALVSSVFHNRLRKKMRLQTDPTILYGLALDKGFMPNNISRADLVKPHRYNSYTNYGLPPTPISNPGRDAIAATLNPAKTNYLYFVSRNDGTTAFSESLNQHNKSVNTFQINPKARQGKSWKDLKKKK